MSERAVLASSGRLRAKAAVGAVVAILISVAVFGAARAANVLWAGASAGLNATGVHRIGDDVPTSFGIVAVEYVREVDGLTHRSLAGASHGVQGLVDGDHKQIQTAVAITNRRGTPISYTSTQFHLRITSKGKTTVQSPAGGDLPDERVLPHAGIEGHLDFTVPQADAQLALQFDDPRDGPIVIDLGDVQSTPGSTGADHNHG